MTDIIKCNKCGHVLISGTGAVCLFGIGVSIGCGVCGNEYTFEKPVVAISKNEKEKLTK